MFGSGTFGSNPYGSFSRGTIYKSLSDSSLGNDLEYIQGNMSLVDTGLLIDIISYIISEISILDSSSGLELLSLANSLFLIDTGLVIDVLSFIVQVYSTDSSIGVDLVSLLNTIFMGDDALGVDANTTTYKTILDKNFNTDILGEPPISIVGEVYRMRDGFGNLIISDEEYYGDNTKSLKASPPIETPDEGINFCIDLPSIPSTRFSFEAYIKFIFNENRPSVGGGLFIGTFTSLDLVTGELRLLSGRLLEILPNPLAWNKYSIHYNLVTSTIELRINDGKVHSYVADIVPFPWSFEAIQASPTFFIQDLKIVSHSLSGISILNHLLLTNFSLGSDLVNILVRIAQIEGITGNSQVGVKSHISVLQLGFLQDLNLILSTVGLQDNCFLTDFIYLLNNVLVQDTITVSELVTILTRKVILLSDFGICSDVVNLLCHLLVTEVSSATEIIDILNVISVTEVSLGVEELGILCRLVLNDSGISSTELLYLVGKLSRKIQSKELVIDKARLNQRNSSKEFRKPESTRF